MKHVFEGLSEQTQQQSRMMREQDKSKRQKELVMPLMTKQQIQLFQVLLITLQGYDRAIFDIKKLSFSTTFQTLTKKKKNKLSFQQSPPAHL